MTNERLFIYNPFNTKNWTNEEVKEQYDLLAKELTQGDEPYEIAKNIDIYANMNSLIGEMISRYYESVESSSVELKVKISTEIYKERDYWLSTKTEKAPAMSYFESKALSKYLVENKELLAKEANLKRFKFAFDSIEQKQNALKKMLEAIKYDTFNQ